VGSSDKRLILIELNEINFDVVRQYLGLDRARFPSLRQLVDGPGIRTSSEREYASLEPWIQWPSVHTAMTFEEHQIFRLGDIVKSTIPQIFERIEELGYSVGVISAMNAANRLKRPSYFIPDPWTQTLPDSSWWSRSLAQAISQTVNDNSSSRISVKSGCQILASFVRFARFKNYREYFRLALSSRRRPWRRALFLDLLLHDIHRKLFGSKKPNFSTLFLNAGAHIQHHYLFNSLPVRRGGEGANPEWYVHAKDDPVAEMLHVYDRIVGEYLHSEDAEIVVATGLTQMPYDRVKYYYRLKSHASFLVSLGVRFSAVLPRMTRDFLIEFDSEDDARSAQLTLANALVEDGGEPLFGEIDNRGSSLFVTLTFDQKIDDSTRCLANGISVKLKPLVSFVAIKNGMHKAEGFAFFCSSGVAALMPQDGAHVSSLGRAIMKYFGVGGS